MSVRRRIWRGPSGESKEAWVVDYVDQHGERHIKTFTKKRDADAHHAIVGVAVRSGTHTADSKIVTVGRAAELWLKSCEAAGLERTTTVGYRQHIDLHIAPILGALSLSQLTVPLVRGFEDRLRRDGRSPAMVRKVRRSLGGILADAQERGLAAQNVAVLLTAIFTGLRASELHGLRWDDVELKTSEIHVRQRADRYGKIGRPSRRRANAPSRSRQCWSPHCASTAWPRLAGC
jgi:hypothetical protein